MNRIKIQNKFIGENDPLFILAEAGVNPDGDLEKAKLMIKKAAEAGADAIKFMCFKTEQLQTLEAKKAKYHEETTGKEENLFDLHKRLELSYDNLKELKQEAEKYNIIFLATPHSNEESVDFLDSIDITAFKIGSGDLNNLPILEYIAKKQKPIILATGMSSLKEVKTAVNLITKYNKDLILLHCTSNYPAAYENMNLKAMQTLMKEFPDIPIGHSDHSLGILVPTAATALGARFIEKHFTLNKNDPGPDHRVSVDPAELKQMITSIRNTEKALGSPEKKLLDSEKEILIFARKSIVAKQNIPAGTTLTNKHITFKRPATGLPPTSLNKILNKKTKINLKADQLIKLEDLE